MFIIIQILTIHLEGWVTCTVAGLTYMEETALKGQPNTWSRGEDPCKPLYWYPKAIPEYCYYKNIKSQIPILPPVPMPIPVPLPQGIPKSMLPSDSYPTYSVLSNQNDLYRRQQTGMVPGLPGLVSSDGGINILPFSDAYSDMLQNHKHILLKKRFKQLIDDYEDFPRSRRGSRRRRKHLRRLRKHLEHGYE